MANSSENVKHKPSKKVVLEDVLTSLQDLVNNEFAEDFADAPRTRESDKTPNVLKKGSGSGSPGLRKRGRPRKHPLPPADTAAPVEAGPTSGREQAKSEPDAYTYSQEQADLFGEASPAPAKAGKAVKKQEKQASKPVRAAKPATLKPETKEFSRPELETPREQTNLKIVGGQETSPRQEFKQDDMANKPSNTAEHLDPDASLGWADDIPVLTEVVDPQSLETQALNMDQLQDVVDRSLQRKDLAPEAREIAVKVAARLNIEMRESGKQLDIKTIMRLQALLKEALEPKD
ncbi:MAG: hypothetical protein ACWGOV_05325 [Acidiferrobacterales bacterium]